MFRQTPVSKNAEAALGANAPKIDLIAQYGLEDGANDRRVPEDSKMSADVSVAQDSQELSPADERVVPPAAAAAPQLLRYFANSDLIVYLFDLPGTLADYNEEQHQRITDAYVKLGTSNKGDNAPRLCMSARGAVADLLTRLLVNPINVVVIPCSKKDMSSNKAAFESLYSRVPHKERIIWVPREHIVDPQITDFASSQYAMKYIPAILSYAQNVCINSKRYTLPKADEEVTHYSKVLAFDNDYRAFPLQHYEHPDYTVFYVNDNYNKADDCTLSMFAQKLDKFVRNSSAMQDEMKKLAYVMGNSRTVKAG